MGTRVFVGGIKDPRLRERDLEDFFRGYGRIREVIIKPGYGFVEFEDLRDAEDAVYERNGKSLCGERVVVEHAMRPGTARRPRPRSPPIRRAPPPSRSRYRVAVDNVSSRASWRDLKAFLSKAGEVTFCDAHRHVNGEGHCEFETREGMERALEEMDGKELYGKRLKLREDRSRSRSPRRRRSGSRSRNRRDKSASRSKSRSPSGSRTPDKRKNSNKDRDRSRSKSPAKRGRKSRSKSKSKSKSPAKERSKTRSATPTKKR